MAVVKNPVHFSFFGRSIALFLPPEESKYTMHVDHIIPPHTYMNTDTDTYVRQMHTYIHYTHIYLPIPIFTFT